MTSDRRDRTVSPGKHVHWFNPENDLALASGMSNYTPPKAAGAIHQAGEALPLWYGADGDIVISRPDHRQWADKVTRDFSLSANLQDSVQPTGMMRPRPWGWSAYTRRYFERLGFDNPTLPTHDQIEKMRMLSHRRTASLISSRLHEMLPDTHLAQATVECRNEHEVRSFLAVNPEAYLKSPWSSSGRGVICTSSMSPERVMRFALDSIRRQGSVMAERAYRKVMDFAMLFECDGGKASSSGTSVFLTDCRGAYIGNLLAPEANRIEMVERHIDGETLATVRESLLRLIDELIAPHYNGVMGVDMLADTDGTLDAAVELNLRTTMGYLANRFADRWLHPDTRGVMRSIPLRTADDIHEDYITEGGRLAGGVLLLSPPAAGFAFTAQCTVEANP